MRLKSRRKLTKGNETNRTCIRATWCGEECREDPAFGGLARHGGLESPAAVRSVTDVVELEPADFAECLPSMKAAFAGCDGVFTFDRRMKGLAGVQVL